MATSLQNGPSGRKTDHESFLARFGRKLTESRYFMLSLLVHVCVVIIAGTVVLFNRVKPAEDFIPAGVVPPVENSLPDTDRPVEKPQLDIDIPKPPPKGGLDLDLVRTTAPSDTRAMPKGPGQEMFVPQVPVLRDIGAGTGGSVTIPGWIPPDMGIRFGPKGKAPGVTENALKAVQQSLKWLRENQNADGSWGDKNRSAMTGLALLCFLGYGELPESADYGLTINRAVQWMLDNGTKFEGRLGMERTFTQQGVYEHGIATYALGEYYALTHDERVKELLAQAVAHIVEGQSPGGGWMYRFDKTADDLSVSGWQIQALKAAHLTNLKLPGVDQALDKAISYIDRVKGPKGGYGYRGPEDRYSLTGVGILASLYWKGNRGELSKGIQWLISETEKNKPVKYRGESADLYAWYYDTQACLMYGGSAWTKWNKWFQDELIGAQSSDGSWPVPGAKGHGPQSDPGRTGAVYRTTLCTLMLEVFYRYMPTHRG
jgi:hypothetical protein